MFIILFLLNFVCGGIQLYRFIATENMLHLILAALCYGAAALCFRRAIDE